MERPGEVAHIFNPVLGRSGSEDRQIPRHQSWASLDHAKAPGSVKDSALKAKRTLRKTLDIDLWPTCASTPLYYPLTDTYTWTMPTLRHTYMNHTHSQIHIHEPCPLSDTHTWTMPTHRYTYMNHAHSQMICTHEPYTLIHKNKDIVNSKCK